MNHDTAKAALAHHDEALRALERLLRVVKEQAPHDDYLRCRMAVAHAQLAMNEISNPIHLEHPDLDAYGLAVRRELPDGSPAPAEPSTPDEKLAHVQTLALGFAQHLDRRQPPNADIFQLCFREFVHVAVLAEGMPHALPEGAAPREDQILDAVIRLAGFVILLNARGSAPAEPTEH